MLSYNDALQRVLSCAQGRILPTERMPLCEAAGRILAAAVVAEVANPAFDNSAMDGFLVCADETAGASPDHPLALTCHGHILAGDDPCGPRYEEPFVMRSGPVCFEIMTGAPLPLTPRARGWGDAVVRVEDVDVLERDGEMVRRIALRTPVRRGSNIRRAGEDFAVGQELAPPGTRLSPEVIMALAAAGTSTVEVFRRPRIAIIVTGSEVVPHDAGGELSPGAVRNSSGPYLQAAFENLGCDVLAMAAVGDELEPLQASIQAAREAGADIVVTTGAVSMGKRDLVGEALVAAGAREVFHKAAIRPGKPVLIARWEDGPVAFGLPGNPISTAVGMEFFVTPYVRALRGQAQAPEQRATLSEAWTRKLPEGFTCFLRARRREDGTVVIVPGQDSFMVGPLVTANGWAVVRAGDDMGAGAPVGFVRFGEGGR